MHAVLVGVDDIKVGPVMLGNFLSLGQDLLIEPGVIRIIMLLDVDGSQHFFTRLGVL